MARGVAVFCALIVSFTYIAGQMRGVGVVFSRYLEVDITTGVFIGMAIVFFNYKARLVSIYGTK